jgi:hypothetical protein
MSTRTGARGSREEKRDGKRQPPDDAGAEAGAGTPSTGAIAPSLITEPGVYDIPAAHYHADPCPEPSLSSSICKMLCLESAAHAFHAHPRLNPGASEEEAERFDIGTAAHALLLEGRTAIAIIDAKDYRTLDAKSQREAAYARGLTPLLAARWADVQAMVASAREQLQEHTDGAAAMFTNGQAERTLVWRDGDVWCRARLDWLRVGSVAGVGVNIADPLARASIDDYKSTGATANPDAWTRSMFFAGFDLQAAWYIRGLKALTGVEATFRFAVQETYPPYALSVIGLNPDALLLAEKKCLYALDKWREARASGKWTGYPRRTCYATLPPIHESWWLEKEMTT